MTDKEKLILCLDAPTGINRLYFGGMATSRLCQILGVPYGDVTALDMNEAIREADEETMSSIQLVFGDMINRIWQHELNEGNPSVTAEQIWVRRGEIRTEKPSDPTGWSNYEKSKEEGV